MAFRGGRGRGRGRGGSFEFRMAKHEPFIPFPEDVKLPDVSKIENFSNEEKVLINWKIKFERFWKTSCYYLEDSKRQDAEIEQYAEKLKRKGQQPQHFGTYMKLNVSNFPAELIQGGKRGHDSKRLRWDTKRDEFSLFDKLEEKEKDGDGKDNSVKEKKDGDEEEEEDLENEEAESSEDDYAQNEYFDDDEDDFNRDDDPVEDYYD
ncbi:glutamic acid-rich protein-like [Dendrobium catenatum]|uniref:DNA-directed RNA polymerase III subunit RPC7 n=1 Tax=Dendrobium catenatum TaxID=906689 RepID=A0A2I0X6V2_9ASPA|nr:glutamic acid-rich protein-like [Dendrobium catenatum]PKU83611.1 hypothetical protein MA16_Dca019838 [Dendrobium catenatum]